MPDEKKEVEVEKKISGRERDMASEMLKVKEFQNPH